MTDSKRVPKICDLYRLQTQPYVRVWDLQKAFVRDRKTNPDLRDVMLIVEHPPVYTLGQGADPNFVKFQPGPDHPPIWRVERGGEVTYHCPGQVVGYPILNLRRHRLDLHWYLRQLEAVIIGTLASFGLQGDRIPGLTGVWVEGRKVAAIGIKASRWITMHGFALNVCPDLSGFEQIVPCGIRDRAVGSMAQWHPEITVAMVQPVLEQHFATVFQFELLVQPADALWARFPSPWPSPSIHSAGSFCHNDAKDDGGARG